MSTEYGTARWLREEYDPETRLLTITVCDMHGDWQHYAERVRIVPADAIVIERADVPPVTVMRSGEYSAGGLIASPDDAKDAREAACAYLALAEYLAAHPPVPPVSDEDVETLAGLLCSVAPLINGDLALARRLLATGRVSVTHE